MKKYLSILSAFLLTVSLSLACAEAGAPLSDEQAVSTYADRTSQRAMMTVVNAEDGAILVTIDWANSAFENVEWTMTGRPDRVPGPGVVYTYSDGRQTVQTFDETGVETDEVIYENGTGTLTLSDDRTTFLWKDDVEDAGAECVFEAYCAESDCLNPVASFAGDYVDMTGQRAIMTVEADGETGALVTIDWANSAFENVEWRFSGLFDAEANAISYENGVMAVQTFDEDTGMTETISYENGTGRLTLANDGTIFWTDDIEDAGNGCVFCFLADDAEDGQNPVMNIVGPYVDRVGLRAFMMIEPIGLDGAAITITWADDADEVSEWILSGRFDTEANALVYENGVRLVQTYDDAGLVSEETVYENGTGRLIVNEDWSLMWIDDIDNAGKDCVFEFNFDPDAE